MEQPKFKKGQCLRNIKSENEIFIDYPIFQRLMTKHYSGFVEEFTGKYSCSWFDKNGKKISQNVSEDILSRDYKTA